MSYRVQDVRYAGAESRIGLGVIPVTAAGASIAFDVGKAVASLFGGGDAKRAKKLKADAQEASTRNHPADRDYLAFTAARGGNVTRYEYDNLRRPLEGRSPAEQAASGLYPVTRPRAATLTIEQADQVLRDTTSSMDIRGREPASITVPRSDAPGSIPWTPIAIAGVGALALIALLMPRGKS